MGDKKEIKIESSESEEPESEMGSPEEIPETDAVEEPAREAAAETASESVEDQLRKQVADLDDRLLRALADFDNYKKRNARQVEDTIRSAIDSLLLEFVEIVDNFERALEHADGQDENDAIHRGTRLIYTQMRDLLARYDVKPIEAMGKPFDPNLHDAMMRVDSDEYDEGTVAMELSKGYMRGSRVLRHSKVGVSSGPADSDS
jgi:molecular chaperone GrpE